MKYIITTLLILGCSGDADPALTYKVESEHVTIEGKSKVDASHARAVGAVNQVILDSIDK